MLTKEEYMRASRKSERSCVAHFTDKLLKLKGMMKTESGRALAQQRHEFMEHFLVQMRAKVEFVGRGADPRLLEGCLNVVLTGNPGAGKTTAAPPLPACNPMRPGCNPMCPGGWPGRRPTTASSRRRTASPC